MIQEITLYRSEVTGELFESQSAATNRDNMLLKEYNGVLLEENWGYANSYIRKVLLSEIKDPKSDNAKLTKDLYDALYSKADVNNRFYNVNPFEIIWQMEYVYSFNSEISQGTNKSYFDYKHAAQAWAKDNAGGGFDQPVNWLVEKGFEWTATSITGGPAQSFKNSMDGDILIALDGVEVVGKANATDEFIIDEEDTAEIRWDSAETAVF